jgi:flagellar biogenesis protein FliO
MPKRKRKSKSTARSPFIRPLVITAVITGLATLILRIVNRRLKISELSEIAGICGTVFVVCLLILVGIWVVKYLNKR